MSYLCCVRNCVDAMEGIASEVVSAHILSQDLIPLPHSLYRYSLPTVYNAGTVEEAKRNVVSCKNSDVDPLVVDYDVIPLLSAQTKKKARLASLLQKSEEASRRMGNIPLNTRNLKEFDEQKPLQRKIEENGEVNLEFLENLTQIFGAHDNGSGSGCESQYARDVEGLAGARLETMEPGETGVPIGISTGLSADNGCESGGLPSNDLQHYIHELCNHKAKKNDTRMLVRNMLSPDALTTVALLVEELASEMVLSWRRRIESTPLESSSSRTPSIIGTGTDTDTDTRIDVNIASEISNESGNKRPRDFDDTVADGVPQPPPPLVFDPDSFSREVDIQLQGADLDNNALMAVTESVVRNRMQVLFGANIVNTPDHLALIHTRVAAEAKHQQGEEEEHTNYYQQECKENKEATSRKRIRF